MKKTQFAEKLCPQRHPGYNTMVLGSGAGSNSKVGVMYRKFFVKPPLFGSISRFGERFRDGRYSLIGFLLAVLLLVMPPPRAKPFVKVGGKFPSAIWSPARNNYLLKSHKYVCIATYQPNCATLCCNWHTACGVGATGSTGKYICLARVWEGMGSGACCHHLELAMSSRRHRWTHFIIAARHYSWSMPHAFRLSLAPSYSNHHASRPLRKCTSS